LFRLIFIDLQNVGVISATPCRECIKLYKTTIQEPKRGWNLNWYRQNLMMAMNGRNMLFWY